MEACSSLNLKTFGNIKEIIKIALEASSKYLEAFFPKALSTL